MAASKLFRVASDLHLEFGNKYDITDDVPYLILAGDICTLKTINKLIDLCKTNSYKKIFYVLGNHEFYGNRGSSPLRNVVDFYRKQLQGTNVFLLDNETHTTEEGLTVAGCTLWSNVTQNAFECMADKHEVKLSEYIEEHNRSIDFLNSVKDRVDIIITHHGPSYDLVDKKYRNSTVNSAFYSDCSGIYNDFNGIWIYGHTHTPSDRIMGTTRFVCNPRGYPGENPSHKKKYIIA